MSLEQVKLLETKVAKAIDFVKSLSEENAALRGKLDGYRRRIDELEVLVKAFKEDQGRIEAGIMSALERLNQFEDAVERGLSSGAPAAVAEKPAADPAPVDVAPPADAAPAQSFPESDEAILAELEAEEAAARAKAAQAAEAAVAAAAEPVTQELPVSGAEEASHNEGAELDIF